ncbi:MAG: HNH endonuclease [Candidatus Dormiibacterota bacterium]
MAQEAAHRLAHELTVDPTPAGLVLDHLCYNRACVNPARLERALDLSFPARVLPHPLPAW